MVPKVLDVFPYAPSALKTLARKASLDEDALESWAENLFEGSNLPAARFFEAPLAVRIRALYRLALKVLDSRSITGFENILGSDTEEMVPSRRIPWAFMASAASSSSSSGILGQGAGLTIELSKGYIQMRGSRPSQSLPAGALCSGFSVEVSAPGRFRIGTVLDCRLYSRKDPGGLRLDAFDWPIIIRSRRSGDKIRLVAGCRHLDRLLADMRVPTEFRDTVPLVEDRAGIVAVLGSLAGSRDIYRKNDALVGRESPGFLVLEMKGVVSDDAVQR